MTTQQTTPSRPRHDQWLADTRPDWGRGKKGKPGIYSRIPKTGPTGEKARAWGYYDEQVKRIVRVQGGRQEAIEAQAEMRLRKGAGLEPVDKRTTVAELAPRALERVRRKRSPRYAADFDYALSKVVLPEVGHIRLTQLGVSHIERVEARLADGTITGNKVGRDSTTKYLGPLRAIVKEALRERIISFDPFSVVEREPKTRRRRYEWSPQAILRFLRVAGEHDRRPEARYAYHPLITTLAYTGLRISEALGLRWGDVDLLGGYIHVSGQFSRESGERTATKTEAGLRSVPIPTALLKVLVEYKPVDAGDDEWVFASKRGDRPVSYWNVRDRAFAPILVKAGLPETVTLHDLRHAAASLLRAQGLNAHDIARQLGHTDAAFTDRTYVHPFDNGEREAKIRAAFDVLAEIEAA